MAIRKIIQINENKCNGCGLCIPNCPEGAIQIIDDKARLISDIFCDGLGACIGHCPEGAITVIEREAGQYNEEKTMENIIKQGKNTIIAHLEHLKDHGEMVYYKQALEVLNKKNIIIDRKEIDDKKDETFHGCPGTSAMEFSNNNKSNHFEEQNSGKRASELKQWPIQLHLVSPIANYYKEKDILLVADCVGYCIGDFHRDFMKERSIAIACPKLDDGKEIYIDKIISLIDQAKIKSLTVMIMEVPCCSGLLKITEDARTKAQRKIKINYSIVNIQGEIINTGIL